MAQVSWSNCPEGIRVQVNCLTDSLRRILSSKLVGVYLHGSLAMGCCNPDRSDLDVLVLSDGDLSLAEQRKLAALALEVSGHPLPLEFSVVGRAALTQWRHPTPYAFHFSEDWRERLAAELTTGGWQVGGGEPVDYDLAAHVTITRQRGVCLYGAPITDVIPAVPHADYVDSILRDFDWAQAGAANTVYLVLNACRVYAYLLDGLICSKDEAGMWALAHLPGLYRPLVQQALVIYRGVSTDDAWPADELAAFSAFMNDQIYRLV